MSTNVLPQDSLYFIRYSVSLTGITPLLPHSILDYNDYLYLLIKGATVSYSTVPLIQTSLYH